MLYPNQLSGTFETLATVALMGEAAAGEVWVIVGTECLAGVVRGQRQSVRTESVTVPCS